MDRSKFLKDIQKNPQQVLTKAKQAKTKNDILALANWWQEDGPKLVTLGVLEVFFAHLDEKHTPSQPTVSNRRTPTAEKAFLSLLGLVKSANFLRDPSPHSDTIIKAWPGVYKWCTFFYAVDIQRRDADAVTKRTAQDLISGTWYSMSRVDRITPIMGKTKGAVELMTQLFVLEDSGAPSMIDIPSASATLDSLIREAEDTQDVLDRIVAASNGRAENVARLCMSRLRTIVNGQAFSTPAGVITLDLIGHLSRKRGHPLRFAFLHHNVIQTVTKVAGTAAKLLSKGGPPSLEGIMVSAFGYLANCLESTDGFTWVTSAIHSGLLQAFVDASILLARMEHPEDRDMIIALFKVVLPKYLVYRSVIQAVDGAMQKVTASPSSRWVDNTPAKDVWQRFKNLTSERVRIVKKIAAVKGNLIMTCDNLKCQKVDYKNNFKKCASCSTSLYCSKECQAIAWKEGGHKTMCKLKVQERLEGKNQSISKADAAFFHSLTIEDLGAHIPLLKKLAAKEYPGVPMTQLIASVDYDCDEPEYHLQLLDGYMQRQPLTGGSNTAVARNEALIERVQENPSKLCLFQTRIANGESNQLVLTMVGGEFWHGDCTGDCDARNKLALEWEKLSEEADDSDQLGAGSDTSDGENIDGELDEAEVNMAKMVLNGFLRSMGEPPAFD